MKKGRQSFILDRPVYFRSSCTIVGPKESEGNYGGLFDMVLRDDRWGEKSYEKAESKMHRKAVEGALAKSGLSAEDIDFILAGDLLNEISASNLAMRHFKVPFLGLYNACSTFTEAVLLGSLLIEAGAAGAVCCSTSSHFASAERQYRYPLELGNQRTPTSQWTVTGAGASVLTATRPTKAEREAGEEKFAEYLGETAAEERENCGKLKKLAKNCAGKYRPDYAVSWRRGEGGRKCAVRVVGGTFGRVVDLGIDDESNMGGAMAPAAADTLLAHFEDTGATASDYDAIYTGDLGRFGKQALEYLLSTQDVDLGDRYYDCGAGFYTPEQQTFQGGSGAGCVNVTFNADILRRMERGELKRVLVLATGALLNKDTPLQKETIPGISHAFVVEAEEMAEEE